MIASLSMYCYPQLEAAHDRFWALIRQGLAAGGVPSPPRLSRNADERAVWNHPQLVLSQTCGMPYRLFLHGSVQLVGTPDYGLQACPAGYYRSALVVRANDNRTAVRDFADARFAYNSEHSQSGFAAPWWHVQAHGFWFARRLAVGQHLEAARAVADGRADIAALDAVSWLLMTEHTGLGTQLRVLEWTIPTPGLPYICARDADVGVTFAALDSAIRELSEQDRQALHLQGLVKIPERDYLAISNPPVMDNAG